MRPLKTDERLITAAAALLDSGGQGAVTLRAVAQAVGVSHNAPYKHFEGRSALLGAVAMQDFDRLTEAFAEVRRQRVKSLTRLRRALAIFIQYGREYPARYRLLFSDPDLPAQKGELEAAAMRSFSEFAAIVRACQEANDLPDVPTVQLTWLIYASVHGMIDLEIGGRMREEKGFNGAHQGVDLLVKLLSASVTSSSG